MKEKTEITTPRLFTVAGKPTPKHDEFLLIFNKDINKYLKYLPIKEELSFNIILDRISERDHYSPFKLDNKYFDFEPKDYDIYFPKEELNVTKKLNYIYSIEEWLPEHPLINNNYYLGSVDLLVKIKECECTKYFIDLTRYWNVSSRFKEFNLLFEFKPEILSFSEVIRQVKVYLNYLNKYQNIIPIVITYSDISKFKDIFESQGIKIIQLKNSCSHEDSDTQAEVQGGDLAQVNLNSREEASNGV